MQTSTIQNAQSASNSRVKRLRKMMPLKRNIEYEEDEGTETSNKHARTSQEKDQTNDAIQGQGEHNEDNMPVDE